MPDIRLRARQIGHDVVMAMALAESGMCLHLSVTSEIKLVSRV